MQMVDNMRRVLRAPFVVGNPQGLLTHGNINLLQRPVVHNPDGSISTVRSITYGINGKQVLMPTVIGDQVVSNGEALKHYLATGQHLGMFDTPENAEAYAQALHEDQQRRYGG